MNKDLSYLQDMDFEAMSVSELLEALNNLWLLDPQCPGECPTCGTIHAQLLKEFRALTNDELTFTLEAMSDEQLHQISAPLDELQEERPVVADYVKY